MRYICFSKKEIKTVLGFKQLLLPILNWIFCAFYTSLLILMFSKHFHAWSYQPNEHSSVFRRLFECKYEPFPERPCSRDPDSLTPSFLSTSASWKTYTQTKPWIRQCSRNNLTSQNIKTQYVKIISLVCSMFIIISLHSWTSMFNETTFREILFPSP